VLAGFWQKSSSWALPRDQRGEGYWQLARGNTAQMGFCLLLVFASGWGQTFLLSIFQPYWMRALELDTADMGLIYGGATLASGLLLPWAGRWLDRAGPISSGTITLLGLAFFSALAAMMTNAAILGVALFGLRFFGQGLTRSSLRPEHIDSLVEQSEERARAFLGSHGHHCTRQNGDEIPS
jgi:MFS family permease